jgi:MYXO-CTERM domain-containing protein
MLQRRTISSRMRAALGFGAAATLALCAAPQSAIAADARADLSFAANPAGAWTYAAFDLTTVAPLASSSATSVATNSWHPTGVDYPFVGLTTLTPAGFVSLHPGDSPAADNPWAAVLFTATTQAVYRFAGEFRALDGTGAGTIADYVIRTPDSPALYTGGLRFHAGPASYEFEFARILMPGQSMMFAVGDGRVTYPASFNGGAFDEVGLKLSVNAFAPGDFNRDGKVNSDDLERFKANYGPTPIADADFDSDSDGRDFLLWQQNVGFGETPTTAVPEPSAWALAGFAAVVIRRRRRSSAVG